MDLTTMLGSWADMHLPKSAKRELSPNRDLVGARIFSKIRLVLEESYVPDTFPSELFVTNSLPLHEVVASNR